MSCARIDLKDFPDQGWKVHVSAWPADAERALQVIWDYCTRRSIAFEYLRREPVLIMHNSRTAERASTSQFIRRTKTSSNWYSKSWTNELLIGIQALTFSGGRVLDLVADLLAFVVAHTGLSRSDECADATTASPGHGRS